MGSSYQFLETLGGHRPAGVGPDSRAGADAGGRQDNEYARISRLLAALSAEVGTSMEEIQQINNMLRMIAFNSRIEAAKAGEAGKAFAIVSGEMRALSEQTALVARKLREDTGKVIGEVQSISTDLATQVRGTRLSDLALTNIDLIDRNLYERSCDVRWWATDASLVQALQTRTAEDLRFASRRLGVILNAYTVYFDLVLCDADGSVVANGRPQRYPSRGRSCAGSSWFQQAMDGRSGDRYGFQSVHASELADGARVLLYSAAVRAGGEAHGELLGALGVVFNYDALAQTIVNATPVEGDLHQGTRVCIVDDTGLLLADSHGRVLQERLDFPGLPGLLRESKGYILTQVGGRHCCVAHARAPGYETYSTGWHSLILQAL